MAYAYGKMAHWPFSASRHVIGFAAIASGLLLGAAASASVVENLSTSTSYTYDFLPGLAGTNSGMGDSNILDVNGSDPEKSTNVKMNYGTIIASDASFFFLHNIQCQGFCSVGVKTTVTDTITNNGSSAVKLRLDSNITAGHLGLVQNAKTESSGQFQFDVTQTSSGVGHQLYQALGQISSAGADIVTSDNSVFNNLTSYQDPTQIGLDWDATDLSLLLDTLAPGQTTTVTYTSFTFLNSYGTCDDFTQCDGVQVAFGDPRNNGGIIGAFALTSRLRLDQQPVGFVLDRGFDLAKVKLDVVDVSGSVPEPGSWGMMLVGFGATGLFARRRRNPRKAMA